MESNERQGRATQAAAWLWVVAVHAGLFWLLTHQDREPRVEKEGPRLRLVFVAPVRPPALSPPATPSPVVPAITARDARLPRRPSVVLSTPTAQTPEAPPATADELLKQGRQWAQENVSPAFGADPFRSRRARLPGGERRGRFRMKESLSAEKVLQRIGQAAGGSGYTSSPCPRIGSNLPGLLTATSDQERELLEEELRRDREYCRP